MRIRRSEERGYAERSWLKSGHTFPESDKRDRFKLVASNDGSKGSVRINQDLKMYAALIDNNERAELALAADRMVWIQVARGSVSLNGEILFEMSRAA